MNKRLMREIDKYFELWMQGASDEGCFNADSQLVSIFDCQRIAQHFYNMALEEVKRKLEDVVKCFNWSKEYDGGRALDDIIDFINELSK